MPQWYWWELGHEQRILDCTNASGDCSPSCGQVTGQVKEREAPGESITSVGCRSLLRMAGSR